MSSETPLPILRLPILVFSEVLKYASPEETVTMSFCSKRMRNLIKLCRDKNIDWQIEMLSDTVRLNLADERFKVIKLSKNSGVEATDQVKFGDFVVPIKIENNILHTFWEPTLQKDGIKAAVDYVCELFNLPVHILTMAIEDLWMVEWVGERQAEPLKDIFLDQTLDAPLTHKEGDMILRKLRPTKALLFCPQVEASFQYTGDFDRVDDFILDSAPWFTIKHLMSLDSIYISIGSSEITPSEMNMFLQYWLSGGCPRFKVSDIFIEGNNTAELFEGFRDKVTVVEQARKYNIRHHGIEEIPCGFDIQRDDGVVATVYNDLIVVWPDMKGKQHFDFI